MIVSAQIGETTMQEAKKLIIHPLSCPRRFDGQSSARYGGTIVLSALTNSHVRKFKEIRVHNSSVKPRLAENREYRTSVNRITRRRPIGHPGVRRTIPPSTRRGRRRTPPRPR